MFHMLQGVVLQDLTSMFSRLLALSAAFRRPAAKGVS